jgi:hypothetical protein
LGFVGFLAYVTRPDPKEFHLRGVFLLIFPGNYELQHISGRALVILSTPISRASGP